MPTPGGAPSSDHCDGPRGPGPEGTPALSTDGVRAALAWFESNGGWAPPDAETMADWMADGVCRCPDDCLVAPDESCPHGLASWWSILESVERDDGVAVAARRRQRPHDRADAAITEAHLRAVEAGEAGYLDPGTGLFVMTASYLADRGTCCGQGCRHCPYPGASPRVPSA